MRASPSLSQLWQPHSRLCQLCRVCEQQRSCSPGFRRKEMRATEGAVEVRRARRRLEDTVTDERVGVFTPDKDGHTHTSCGRAAVIDIVWREARDRLWRSGSRPPISSTHGPLPPYNKPCNPWLPRRVQLKSTRAPGGEPGNTSWGDHTCSFLPTSQ